MKLIFVLGVQIVLVYGQPIFTPMAGHVGVPVGAHVGAPAMGGHFGLPIDTLGAASGYAGGGAGFPLLSPMELNAIMEAQARGGNFKAAFTPDTEPQGFAGYGQQQQQQHGGFMPNFEDGFGQEGNSEFYEAPHHGEPFPAHEADSDVKQPEPKGRDNRDNRGPYHKDDAIEDGPSSEGPQEPQEPREIVNGRGGQIEPSNGHPGQQRGYREEERDSGEPQIQNEPALRGAYREYRGEGGSSSSPSNGHPRQRGGYRDEERDSGEVSSHSGQNEPNSRGAYREYRGEGGHNNNGQSEAAEGQEGSDGPESFVGGHDQRENYNYQ
ncbi:pro-resilin-like [Panonychus citri]|uniref:pro-resilin-like n=1 Tax=Panonychus citri TaxID=50023 RepID=UPI002307262A|nr:pro-resilin-like [Panonychus citri]